MNLKTYAKKAQATAIYPGSGSNMGLAYAALGLAGEAGEVANKVKKVLRDGMDPMDPAFRQAVKNELGDILWYVAAMGKELNIGLDEIAETNIEKLESRKVRGALKGSGDNR